MISGELSSGETLGEPLVDGKLLRGLGTAAAAVIDPTLSDYFTNSYSLLASIQEEHPFIEVRQEQAECLDAIQEARIGGRERALVQMATGLGKTMVVAADVKRFLTEKPEARVLFLCHQNDILQQAQESFSSIIGEEHSYGAFTGESKDYHEVTCLFASFQAMREWREAFLPEEFDYIVVDESHHAKAPTYEPTLDYFQPEFMLGVTATPDRHDLRDIREIFGSEVYRLSLEEAIARNLLTPVDYHVIIDDIADKRVLQDARGVRYNYAQLDREIFIPKRTEEIVQIINNRGEDLEQVKRIVFCKSIEQANQYSAHFEGSFALHSDIPKNQQDQLIHHFKNGIIQTLLVVDMFNEGIDIPEANQIVFLRSTESKTIFFQQLGRGLRKSPGKDVVQVLDFVASCDRLIMLDEMWQEIASTETSTDVIDKERILISVNGIDFDDSSREILDILADIESNTNAVRNMREQGWRNMAELEKILKIGRGTILQLASHLGIPVMEFSNGRGTLRYVSPDQVNILKSWVDLSYHDAPNDHTTITGLAESLGVATSKIERIMREAEVRPGIYRSLLSRKLIPFLSPAEVEVIAAHPHMNLQKAPEGYTSKNQLKDEIGISFKSLTAVLEQLEIEPKTFLTPLNYPGSFLSESQAQRVQAYVSSTYGETAPKDLTSYNSLMSKLGITEETMSRICTELGVIPTMARNARGHMVKHVDTDSVTKISQHSYLTLPFAPKEYLNIGDLEELTKLSDITVVKIADELGIDWTQFKNHRGHVTRYMSPEQADKFLTHPLINTISAPEGYESIAALANRLGVSYTTINKICRDAHLQVGHFKTQIGTVSNFLSQDQVAFVSQHPQIVAPFAPPGYETFTDIAKLLGTTPTTLRKALAKTDVTPQIFKHPKIKRIAKYYSAQQIDVIRELYTNYKTS